MSEMKRILFAAAVALTPLSACSTLPAIPSAQQTLVDDKALLAAEAAFQGALISADAGVQSGLLKGTRAAQVRVTLEKARAALLVTRRTKATADAFAVLNLAAEVKGITQ